MEETISSAGLGAQQGDGGKRGEATAYASAPYAHVPIGIYPRLNGIYEVE